ncbi:tetraacyldisaccharide 4'-kinase [Flagellimonas beolgyonensis]|uniref:tetraacyldisaccharide 4'-kinase n=1 Tax=Flagellimonas beolgyonensis TaxID=864064 RepID=UPI000F8D61FB|nr:tetraacyldisaccharide 4'-kinase [Allomuricauda beolgyonensis]
MLQLLRKIAFPFSLLYALVVYVRNRLYDFGVFTSKSYTTPTICVGNVSVGGTGKTPMTEYLIRMLSDKRVAILSRGYKRKSNGFVLADWHSSVLDLGDEPFQLHRKFPEVAVAVDADRRNGIEQLESIINPDVIVLDDAFQHRKVKPTFSILLTAIDHLYVKDWYLPTGNLRDSKREARRADIIVVTKCPVLPTESERTELVNRLRPLAHQDVLFATLSYAETIKNGEGEELPLQAIGAKKVALVTGIASPKPLLDYLYSKGMVFDHFQFGDHHHFSDADIQRFSSFELILTTEKDFVRLHGKVNNLYYLEISHHFDPNDRTILENKLKSVI